MSKRPYPANSEVSSAMDLDPDLDSMTQKTDNKHIRISDSQICFWLCVCGKILTKRSSHMLKTFRRRYKTLYDQILKQNLKMQ